MVDDQQLLRQYAADGSEAAFGELVGRYVNLVYSAALRRTGGDIHLAQDVAQMVFTDLARKASSLPRGVVLGGWLHRATSYATAQLLRSERRRQAREQEAVAMNALTSEPAPDWEQIHPLLDEALDRLGAADRDALEPWCANQEAGPGPEGSRAAGLAGPTQAAGQPRGGGGLCRPLRQCDHQSGGQPTPAGEECDV
jgi:DNA-directed RNA polymerase specialized sigma24 family protein